MLLLITPNSQISIFISSKGYELLIFISRPTITQSNNRFPHMHPFVVTTRT
ncbi:hypothetical protein Hanom_Chr05g00445371 [Helianthus anomalus]